VSVEAHNPKEMVVLRTHQGQGDATSFTFGWGEDVLQQAQAAQLPQTDLQVRSKSDGQAARAHLDQRKGCPDLLAFYGHGLDDALLCPGAAPGCHAVLLGLNDLDMLRNKHICATACYSAETLGARAVAEGAVCYVGYTRRFYFHGPSAEHFRECANAWGEPILQEGTNWATAVERMRAKYEERIDLCDSPTGAACYGHNALIVKGYLCHDLDCLKFHGDGEAVFRSP
jgi:hypothetical protein